MKTATQHGSRRPAQRRRLVTTCAIAACLLPGVGAAGVTPEPPSHAVVLNITRTHLDEMLDDTFRAHGGPSFTGDKDRVSRTVSDLSYRLRLSEPRVELDDAGGLRVRLEIREAELDIGLLQKRVAGRLARCEGAGVRVDPERPIGVELALRLGIRNHALHVAAENVTVSHRKDSYRLIKPRRCRNNVLPKWLMWWLGKPRIRNKLRELDTVLLANAGRNAERLSAEGLLTASWTLDDEAPEALELHPGVLDTSGGSLFVGFDPGRPGDPAPPAAAPRPGAADGAPGSWVGVSEAFLNTWLARLFSGPEERTLKSGGNLGKLFRSSALFTLIPGLRHVEDGEAVSFTLRTSSPPRIEVVPAAELRGAMTSATATVSDEAAAALRVRFADIELRVHERDGEARRLIGTLAIEEGRVTVLPTPAIPDGVSLRLVENHWTLSSSGIAFNDALFGSVIQELVFGAIFETGYAPLNRGGWIVGDTTFRPAGFRAEGGYLFIDLTTRLPLPDLQASRDPR